jgi:hypothetical protein
MKHRLALAVLALIAALGAPSPARAAEGEGVLSGGLSFDAALGSGGGASYGFGALALFRHGLADDWNLYVAGSYAGLLGPGPRADLGGLTVGASYVLDAVTWVPEIYAGVGVFGSPATGAYRTDVGVEAGLQLDWRRYREFAVGGRVGYRFLVLNRDRLAGEVTLAVHVSTFF